MVQARDPAATELSILTALARDLQLPMSLEEMQQRVVDRAAELLATVRVNIRLLDASGSKLAPSRRAGAPLHWIGNSEFALGQGLVGWIARHASAIRAGNAESDPRFQPRPDMRSPMGSFLGVPLLSGTTCIGVLSAVNPAADYFTDHHEDLLVLLAAMCAPHLEIARLSRVAQVDPLTGALNRRGLDEAFSPLASSGSERLTVAMVDVDHFKRVNDEYGHAVGDEALKSVAAILGSVLRFGDSVIRYGGEEFLLLLPGVGLDQAGQIAERARYRVAESTVEAGAIRLRMTVSIGIAERAEAETRDALIARADGALYAAKRAGRDRIAVAGI